MDLKKLLSGMFLLLSFVITAQEQFPPDLISQGTFIKKTIPLRDMPTVNPNDNVGTKELTIIPNKLRANKKVNENALPLGEDPVAQRNFGGVGSFALEENFDGATVSEGGALPPDPTGAVGPNHYVHAVNLVVKIFDKNGGLLTGPTALGTFLGSGNNSGDPIVMYDQLADRFFVSQFKTSNNALIIGVSETSDPTGAYFVYEFPLNSFPDYPHYAVWHNAYFLTANKFSGNTTYAIERDAMLAGDPNPQIVGFNLPGVINNPNTVFSPEPANLTGTAFPADVPGYITYLQDDGWGGVTFDHLKIWEIDLDWVNTGNSSISAPLEIPTAPFEATFAPFGTGDVNQPGTSQKIDMIGGVISYAANYRSFGSHNSWLITFNVDVDGSDTSGIRWIELRNDGSNDWAIFQEGTYAPADGHSRFMGSAAMDAAGNIGMGFNIASGTLPAGIRYTGRFDGDPLGQMTVAETTIIDGVGVQTTTNRFGDYSHLTVDPNNFTFWHTAEYFTSNNFWTTRIASFSLSGGFTNDVGVNNILQPSNGILTNAETVDISIRNFGLSAQTGIPLELRVNGVLMASEIFPGTLNPGDTATFTFAQTLDLSTPGQTYTIEVSTDLTGDEFAANDSYTKEVTHLLANDVGALVIAAPESGSGLGNETVIVTIKNYGASPQSNFDVQYSIDGGTPVVESFTATINSEEEINFSFAQTGDFTALGTYNVTASTGLTTDGNTANNETSAVIENFLCQPSMDCSFGDGFQLFSVTEINNPSGCEGYADFTNLVANLTQGNTYDLTVTTGYGDQHVNVWIDFNDDYTFTPDELVVNDYVIAPGQGSGTYTETMDLTVPVGAADGQHIMRAKTNWNAPVPADACDETTYGETEDYTANIGLLGVEDNAILVSDVVVTSLANNQFEITMTTPYNGIAYMAIYNVLGQQLGFKYLTKEGNAYKLKLDMSHVASGVYLLKVGGQDTRSSRTVKIIVK